MPNLQCLLGCIRPGARTGSTDLEYSDLARSTVQQEWNVIGRRCRMCVRFHLYPEWHALLTAVLLGCKLCAYTVNFDGNLRLHLRPRIPDKLDTVQLMRVNLHVEQATTQRDIYTSFQHTYRWHSLHYVTFYSMVQQNAYVTVC